MHLYSTSQFIIFSLLISLRGAESEHKMTYLSLISSEGTSFVWMCLLWLHYYFNMNKSYSSFLGLVLYRSLQYFSQAIVLNHFFFTQVSSTHTNACRAPSRQWPSANWRSIHWETTAKPWPSKNSGLLPRLFITPRGCPGWPVTLSSPPWLRMVIYIVLWDDIWWHDGLVKPNLENLNWAWKRNLLDRH